MAWAACKIILVSASSKFDCRPATSANWSLEICNQIFPLVTCLLRVSRRRVYHSTTRNLMRLALLAELLRNFLHCWIRWHGTMIWKIFLFDISVFLVESSRYVAKTKSIMWLLTPPSCRMWFSAESACWENVWSLPFIFWTRLIPSVMVTEGSGIVSAGKTCFCLARAALLIFINVPSPLTSGPGNGPSVREMTSLIRRWRFSPTSTTWANRFLRACRVTLFQLLAVVFFRISENNLNNSLFFVMELGLWYFVYKPFSLEFLVCFKANLFGHQECALLHLDGLGYLSKCWQSHFHLDRKVVQSSSRSFTMNWTPASMILSMCRSWWLRWVIPRHTIFRTCFMYSCSTQKWGSTSPDSPLQAEYLCGSCCLGIWVYCILHGLIHGDAAEGILATTLDTETTLH